MPMSSVIVIRIVMTQLSSKTGSEYPVGEAQRQRFCTAPAEIVVDPKIESAGRRLDDPV